MKVRSSTFARAAGSKRRVDVGVQGSRCALREHCYDRVWFAADQDRLPQNTRVGSENISPKSVTENDGIRPVGPILVFRKIATQDRLNPEHVKIVRRNTSSVHVFHLRTRFEIHPRSATRGHRRDQRRNIVAQQLPLLSIYVVPFIGCGGGAYDAGVNRTHSFRMRIRQALQQERVH